MIKAGKHKVKKMLVLLKCYELLIYLSVKMTGKPNTCQGKWSSYPDIVS